MTRQTWVVWATCVAVASGVAWRGWVPPVLTGPPGVLYAAHLDTAAQLALNNLVAADAACGRAVGPPATWAAPGATATLGLAPACGDTLETVAALCGVLCEALGSVCAGTVTQVPGCPPGAVSRRGVSLDPALHWCTLVPVSNSTRVQLAGLAAGPLMPLGSDRLWTPPFAGAAVCVAVGLRPDAVREAAAPTAVLVEMGATAGPAPSEPACPFLPAGALWWVGPRWPGAPDPSGCVSGPTPVHGLAATADAAVGGLVARPFGVSVSLGEFAAAATRGGSQQVSAAAVTEAVVCLSALVLPWECLCGRAWGGVGPGCEVPVPGCAGDFVGATTGPPPLGPMTAATGAADPRVVTWRGGAPPVFGSPVLQAVLLAGSWGWTTAGGEAPAGPPVCVPGGCVNGGAGPGCADEPCNPEAAGGFALAECGGPGVGHCTPGTPGACECEPETWADPWAKCQECLPGAVRRDGACVWNAGGCFLESPGAWPAPAEQCAGAGLCLLPGTYPGVTVGRATCVCDPGYAGPGCTVTVPCAGGEGPLGTQVCGTDPPPSTCEYLVVALPLGAVGGGAGDTFLGPEDLWGLDATNDGWVAQPGGDTVALPTAAERVCRVARGGVHTLQGVPDHAGGGDSGSQYDGYGDYGGGDVSVSVLPVWVDTAGVGPPVGWPAALRADWPGLVAARVAQTHRVGVGMLQGVGDAPRVPPVVLCVVPGCALQASQVKVRMAGLGVVPGGVSAAPVTLGALLAGGQTWAGPALAVVAPGRSPALARVCTSTWGVYAPREAVVWGDRVQCGVRPGPEVCGAPTGTALEVLAWVEAQTRLTALLQTGAEAWSPPWAGLPSPVVFTAWVGVPGQAPARVWALVGGSGPPRELDRLSAEVLGLQSVGSVVGVCGGDGRPVAFPGGVPAGAWVHGGVV